MMYELVNSPKKLKILAKRLVKQIKVNCPSSNVNARVELEKGTLRITFNNPVKIRISLRNKIDRLENLKIKRFIEIDLQVLTTPHGVHDGVLGTLSFVYYHHVYFQTYNSIFTSLGLSTNRYVRPADINIIKDNVTTIHFVFKRNYDIELHEYTSRYLNITLE